jgi:hypothetical protein
MAPLCLLLLVGAVQAQPGAVPSKEHKLMAAYLYRFAAFVDWPDEAFARPDSPFVIGIAGDDALVAAAGQELAGRQVRGHRVAVRRVRTSAAPAGMHILFVAAPAHQAALLEAVRRLPVLTVCDTAAASAASATSAASFPAAFAACVVSVHADGARLRFHVARDEAALSRLRVSARLLAVGP